MTANLIKIGNSQGIRIPKDLIKQFNIKKVLFEIKKDGILLRPIKENDILSWDTPELRKLAKNENLNLQNEFKFSDHRMQTAQHRQNLVGFLTKQHRRTIHRQHIVCVEPARQQRPHLLATDIERHALKSTFQAVGIEVVEPLQSVCLDGGFGVLNHHLAVFVVGIYKRICVRRQVVKKQLLCPDVLLEGLVIIQVVEGDIGEYAQLEL